MRYPTIVLMLLAGFGIPLSTLAAPPAPGAMREIEVRLGVGDFDGALKRITALRGSGAAAPELSRFEAVSRIGKAIRANNSAEEESIQLRMGAAMRPVFDGFRNSYPNDPFVKQVAPLVEQHVLQVRNRIPNWSARLTEALEQARLARDAAAEARRLGGASAGADASDSIVLAWAELYQYLLMRDTGLALEQMSQAGIVDAEVLTSVRKTLPDNGNFQRTTQRLLDTYTSLSRDAAKARSPTLPLALVDGLSLFCAANGRFNGGSFLAARRKFTVLPNTEPAPLPLGNPPSTAVAEDPARVLASEGLFKLLAAEPEAVLFVAAQQAARLDPERKEAAAQYGLYLLLLQVNEPEAGKLIELIGKERQSEPAFVLEKARFTLRAEKDLKGALEALLAGIRGQRLSRPLFSTLPAPLRRDWMATQHARELGASLALGYEPLFRMIGVQASEAMKTGRSSLPYLSLRLRLAELLLASEFLPDVLLGIKEYGSSVRRLGRLELPEEQRAQLTLYQQRLQEIEGRYPAFPQTLYVTPAGVETLYQHTSFAKRLVPPFLNIRAGVVGSSFVPTPSGARAPGK